MKLGPKTHELTTITRDGALLEKAEIIGTGVMLFEASILDGMEKPWFVDGHYPGTNNTNVMQDVAFVQRLNNMGFQVWCDTQIIIKHLGVLEIDDSFMWRFE